MSLPSCICCFLENRAICRMESVADGWQISGLAWQDPESAQIAGDGWLLSSAGCLLACRNRLLQAFPGGISCLFPKIARSQNHCFKMLRGPFFTIPAFCPAVLQSQALRRPPGRASERRKEQVQCRRVQGLLHTDPGRGPWERALLNIRYLACPRRESS